MLRVSEMPILRNREVIVESRRDKDKEGVKTKKECEIRDYPAAFWRRKTRKGETT